MRSLVSAINLLNSGFAYLINLALSAVIADPYLIWDFGGPAIVGGVVTVFFVSTYPHHILFGRLLTTDQYWNFRHIDKEEYVLSTNQVSEASGTRNFIEENDLNQSENRPPPIADNEQIGISQKM